MYLYETSQNIEQLELCILEIEKLSSLSQATINEIFRIMHTIKGSSAMMLFHNITELAHTMEDLFYYLRENKPGEIDYSKLSSFILEGIDFIQEELDNIIKEEKAEASASSLIDRIKDFLVLLKKNNLHSDEIEMLKMDQPNQDNILTGKDIVGNYYKATIFFADDCEMENIRAYAVVHNLQELVQELHYYPKDIIDQEESKQVIREEGFTIYLKSELPYIEMHEFFHKIIFLKTLDLIQYENEEEFKQRDKKNSINKIELLETTNLQQDRNKVFIEKEANTSINSQSIISVNIAKLDKLMDLVGEMVIAEAMVTQNPDLKGLELENFKKAARQLHKITSELQDTVMSVRMVPLSSVFNKMQRIVRDMSKKLGKEVQLELIGEETEVDKNIIEHISDPLMHLVRNAIDHGIESAEDRKTIGKPAIGKITLEAKNAGGNVLIIVKDDGKGLNKDKIIRTAKENGLITKSESELTEKEIYNLIFLPGFSTKKDITEYSGRGVGMDVVTKNIEAVGGTIFIDSKEDIGSAMTLKIPLTLAIIDGMNIKVGNSIYTIPIVTIKESFRPQAKNLIKDLDGNEMIMMRGQCYPILRLHDIYKVKTNITAFTDGIFIMVELDDKMFCIFADELLGQQQVVVKSLPNYIKKTNEGRGLAGCTLLGDGKISLILDVSSLYNFA